MPSETPKETSRTALGVAAQRAIHQILDGEPKILADPVALHLLGAPVRRAILAGSDRARAPERRPLRSHVILRSRFAEDRLAAAVRRGVVQAVILGAGFDTFAYRQPGWAGELRLFEVDHPATQRDKRDRLSRAGIPEPPNLAFAAIDFETTALADGLRAGGVDFGRPTFFSCLGVLMYLTSEAVMALFRMVAGFPPGSEIAFTVLTPDSIRGALADTVTTLGEPWLSCFEPDDLRRDLLAAGFTDVALLDPVEAERRFFAGRDDGLHAPPHRGIAAALVG